MIFQALDDKENCVAIYIENDLIKEIPENLTKSWSYSAFLKGRNIDYAQLYCEGKSLGEVCPDNLKENWDFINYKLKAFLASFKEAKVSLRENCFYDLVPKKFLLEYCFLKNEITEHVLKTYPKPQEYEFFRRFNELLTDIKFRELNIDLDVLKNNIITERDLSYFHRIRDAKKYVNYNLYGSITGRLSTKQNSFPIQNFQKAYRGALKPQNDWFVSIDVNAAEFRTSLALLNKEQPQEDMYEWIGRDILGGLNRTDTKKIVTEWLYNSSNPVYQKYAPKLDALFDKNSLKTLYWVDGYVHTPFGRKIESDEHHAIPYLNQSTFIDLYHRQILKVDDYLKGKKTFISFLLHDEFVLDLADDEKNDVLEILKIVQDTKYGKFLANVKIGKNYGEMKKIKLKV
jgi:hypothetical protein